MPGTPLQYVLAPQAGTPNPITRLTTPFVRFQPLAGFATASPQDSTPYLGPWVRCAEGMILRLTLTCTSLSPAPSAGGAGALDIEIQEVADPEDETEPLETVLSQQFRQPPASPAPTPTVPFTSKIVSPTKGYVRVVATPGTAAGQSAVWQITGHGYMPGRSQNN